MGTGKEWAGTGEVARRLGISRQSVRRLVEAGRLPASQPAGKRGHLRFRVADVDRLLRPVGNGAERASA